MLEINLSDQVVISLNIGFMRFVVYWHQKKKKMPHIYHTGFLLRKHFNQIVSVKCSTLSEYMNFETYLKKCIDGLPLS